jgi:hypothetical protein
VAVVQKPVPATDKKGVSPSMMPSSQGDNTSPSIARFQTSSKNSSATNNSAGGSGLRINRQSQGIPPRHPGGGAATAQNVNQDSNQENSLDLRNSIA